jgi:hypothetical protein
MKKSVSIISAFLLSIPWVAKADFFQSVTPECLQCGQCSSCDAFIVVNNGVDFIVTISAIAALLIFVAAGIMMIISAGSMELVERSKRMLIGAVIGIVFIFSSWILVNFIIATLAGGDTDLDTTAKLFGGVEWNTICSQQTDASPCTEISLTGILFAMDSKLKYPQEQQNDASNALIVGLNCVATNYTRTSGGGTITVTSITHDNLYGSSPSAMLTGNTCTGECEHGANSLHWQGRAADLRIIDKTQEEILLQQTAASSCGFKLNPEGNHLHIQL